MDPNSNFVRQFEALFNGNPWIECSIMDTLHQIEATKAAAKPQAVPNSIWQIVHHMACWRKHTLANIKGDSLQSPADNYFVPVKDTSAKAWETAKENLAKTQQDWLEYLNLVLTPEKLEQTYNHSEYTISDIIHGLLQHDSYHLGQLAWLAKYDL